MAEQDKFPRGVTIVGDTSGVALVVVAGIEQAARAATLYQETVKALTEAK